LGFIEKEGALLVVLKQSFIPSDASVDLEDAIKWFEECTTSFAAESGATQIRVIKASQRANLFAGDGNCGKCNFFP
jgi:hypothetical protein